MAEILVVCIGNEIAEGDALGPEVAKILKKTLDNVRIEEIANYIDILNFLVEKKYDKLIVVDTVMGDKDCEVVEFKVNPGEDVKAPSYHSISFFDALRLARALGVLPEDVVVVGIEVNKPFGFGELPEEIFRLVPVVARRVVEICKSLD